VDRQADGGLPPRPRAAWMARLRLRLPRHRPRSQTPRGAAPFERVPEMNPPPPERPPARPARAAGRGTRRSGRPGPRSTPVESRSRQLPGRVGTVSQVEREIDQGGAPFAAAVHVLEACALYGSRSLSAQPTPENWRLESASTRRSSCGVTSIRSSGSHGPLPPCPNPSFRRDACPRCLWKQPSWPSRAAVISRR